MSITDELREWTRTNTVNCSDNRIALVGIAERIDAEHKRMYADLTVGMEPMTEESMAEHGWVKLPKDADGVLIRIGDRIEYNTGGRDTVRFLTINCDGWTVNERGWKGETMHHIQPDSWERIIEDAMEAYQFDDGSSEPSIGSLVERCKRLAGGGA